MLRLTSFVITSVCVWSVAVPAYSQTRQADSEYATTLVDAIREYNAGKYPEARALFQRAHELDPNARTLRGLGLVEYKLNHPAAAVRLLTAAVSDARRALTPEIKRESERLLEELRGYVGSYHIAIAPAGATLTVDGSPTDASEQPLLLDVGEHLLSIHSPGYQPQERRLNVKGGEAEDLHIDLLPESPASAPVEAPAAAEPAVPPDTTRELPEAPPPTDLTVRPATSSDEQSPSARTTWGFVSLGTGAVSLTGTVIAWRISEAAAARWNDDERCLRDGGTREKNCGADQDTAKTARTWATAGLIATGVFGAAATLLLWPRQQHSERSTGRMQCVVAGVGVACAMSL